MATQDHDLAAEEQQINCKDRLSTLPPELLADIFAYSETTAFISKTFLPYTRRNRFRDVKVVAYSTEGYERLGLLVRVLVDSHRRPFPADSPPVGSLVRSLKLYYHAQEEEKQSVVLPGHFEEMFAAMSGLEVLDITDIKGLPPGLLSFILADKEAPTYFPKIRKLSLNVENTPLIRSTHLCDYSTLNDFPSLTILALNSPLYLEEIAGSQPNYTIKAVEVRLNGWSLPTYSPFFLHYQALESLTFHTERPWENLDVLLSNLAPSLRTLIVMHLGADDFHHNDKKINGSTLSGLKNLRKLSLGSHTTVSSFYDFLKPPLPLVALELGDPAPIDTYLAFIRGRERLQDLKVLSLDFWQGMRLRTGKPLKSEDEVAEVEEKPERNRLRWYLPVWSSGFTSETSQRLIRMAEAEGVKIEGSIHEAIRVQVAWEEEKERVLQLAAP